MTFIFEFPFLYILFSINNLLYCLCFVQVKELSQINPLKPKNTSASEEVIDADPISYKLPNEEKIRVYEPKMSFLKEQILTDLPETITPKDKAWINETDTLNKKVCMDNSNLWRFQY